ncbi:alpha-tectorin-like isoform X3 [Siniperca chuatsi]|uniref:alpha-tectorin-like isoform X3 n=1 Tax=Siniperca chuatsi TaxID=119488 RepID=UPI001CE10E85|nr:alpha-tectorin-like isoform X3 [Siniperca chuatsi]
MLRPLLLLSALIGLAGAQETVSDSSVLDISSCPITFYGQKYEKLYVNINSETFTVCFNNYFTLEKSQDCIVGPPVDEGSVKFDTTSPDTTSNQMIRDALPTIKSDLKGFVEFFVSYEGSKIQMLLGDYGTQAVLVFLNTHLLKSVKVFNVVVSGETVSTLNIKGRPSYNDISGCRHSGVLYKPGAVMSSDPETCSSLVCSETAVSTSTGCRPTERCAGNNICILDSICTVTGPTVIDFLGQVNSVDDRCAYSLMSGSSVPDLNVLANFQERRRKDVSLLDSVTLRLNKTGVHIQLEQGGRVQVDNSVLTLNSSAQLVKGVELSKDQTGVTAKLLISGYNTTVFFDGNTAQIRFTGPAGKDPSLQGLCGNSSSSLSEARLPQYSASNCTMQYTDTADSTINCNTSTERCNLLKEAPFTTCHSHTDPTPYITACTETLCNYPAVDGLNCQFLEAYARVCSLRSNDKLVDWRSKAGCSPPQVFCQDRICSAHEFCAEKTVGGEHSCLCRAIFASPYRLTGTFGEPTVCDKNSGSVTLVGCLLEEKGIDFSSLHLNNQTCTGQMNELTHMLTFNFDSSNTCGTVATAENNQLIYKNTITTQNSSSDNIVRHNQVYIDFSCFYTLPDIKTMAFKIKDSSVIQQIVSGAWNYTLSIKAYTDAGLTQAVELSTEVQLDQKIWVEMKTDGLDAGLVAVVTDSCWATNQASPNGSLRYDLITKGCANPADQTVKVVGNGLGTSNYFSFNMFSFPRSSGDIYLHCKLNLCGRQNKSCAPSCNRAHRRRRSARMKYENEAPAFITMAWTN